MLILLLNDPFILVIFFDIGCNSLKLSMDADYISDLPADLKEKILVKLPIKEVARTSILSSKWKDSWKSIPSLVLERKDREPMPVKLVDNVLMVHRGPILEFKLSTYDNCNEAIGRWMLILSTNGIRDLQLRFWGYQRCNIPSDLFSCLALERLDFSGCTIDVPQFFQGFKLLRTLWLSRFDLSGINLGNFISSCPLLENLALSNFVQPGCLHILAPNLRKLHIWGEFHDLCLQTPKLASGCICLSSNNRDYQKFSVAKSGNESNISSALGCLHNI
ncbi:F-box family protein [Rhynchospora pubera]|uniref:F-box family protein n=1 Tax=Rhynchospora pubera TaxID=906938 RepID=A0AAV8H9J8_9POAL|nr:F-box family protein [Rhynchospora pubera]